jgi:predicted transcriptional regulator of viral defense system
MSTQAQQVLALARDRGVLRPRDLQPLGIPRSVLGRLVEDGLLERVGRGLYRSPQAELGPHHTLVEVAAQVPSGVVNLLSALAFHDLTDELPGAVWLAIPRGSQSPKVDTVRLELTWTAPRFLTLGVVHHTIEGITVPVTDPARTVADCFKYRSRVGVDVAIAALRDYLATHRAGRDTLWRMAELCRVRSVLRPYLESLS